MHVQAIDLPEDTPVQIPFKYNNDHVMIEYLSRKNNYIPFLSDYSSYNNITNTFLPDRVQAILNECDFDANDMKTWKDPIEVPIGVKTDYFIAREVTPRHVYLSRIGIL